MFPTATSFVPDQATPVRLFAVPEARRVHVTPSGEVRMVPGMPPEPPTATNSVPVQATAWGKADAPDERGVQVTPSGEVRITSLQHEPTLTPTVTNCVPDDATPSKKVALPE